MDPEQRDEKPLAGNPAWADPDRSIVVGVDGSERNRAAVVWAREEALGHSRPITLIHVLDERRVPHPFHALETDDQHAWHLLDTVESELLSSHPRPTVRKEVALGPVATSLVDRSADESALVVGRRGFGTFLRLLIGSASLDVASRAHVPVVVVPDQWPADVPASAVVVGIDPRDLQQSVLHYAFTEARMRGAPLVAAYGRDLPEHGGDTSASRTGRQSDPEGDELIDALEQALEPYRLAFPGVSVSVVVRPAHPLGVLLDEGGPTQLLVLGRHGDNRGGFPFGSVAHGVLHYADVPVAIVPPDPPNLR